VNSGVRETENTRNDARTTDGCTGAGRKALRASATGVGNAGADDSGDVTEAGAAVMGNDRATNDGDLNTSKKHRRPHYGLSC